MAKAAVKKPKAAVKKPKAAVKKPKAAVKESKAPACSKVKRSSKCDTVKGCTYLAGTKPPCKKNYGLKDRNQILEIRKIYASYFKDYLKEVEYRGRSSLTTKADMIKAITREGLLDDFDNWIDGQL